jgi:Uncharacterized conserved protein
MIIAIPVTEDGLVDPRFGKAQSVAVAQVDDGKIDSWNVHQVGWGELHDQGTHGSHHARIVRFLRENDVEAVVINHCGAPMMNTMQKMGLSIAVNAAGQAQEAVLQAVQAFQ